MVVRCSYHAEEEESLATTVVETVVVVITSNRSSRSKLVFILVLLVEMRLLLRCHAYIADIILSSVVVVYDNMS